MNSCTVCDAARRAGLTVTADRCVLLIKQVWHVGNDKVMMMMMMTMNWLSPVTAYIARSMLDVATCKRSEKRENVQVYLMRTVIFVIRFSLKNDCIGVLLF